MSRFDMDVRVTPSLLDRLIDEDPRQPTEPPKSRSTTLMELKQAVRRDLSWLLNTRSHAEEIDPNLEEVNKSIAVYGLPDITGVSAKNHLEQKKLTKAIEAAIKNFEPRFLEAKVILEPIENAERQFKFRIEARLDVEPTPEPVTFDTVLRLGSGEFEIKER